VVVKLLFKVVNYQVVKLLKLQETHHEMR